MPRTLAVTFVLIACLFAFVPASLRAQEGKHEGQHVNCPYCNHVGDRECKKCARRQKIFKESGAIYDSELVRCKSCGGSFRIDCKKCDNVAVQDRNQRRIDKLQEWLAERRKTVDELVSHKCMHAQSRWFRLTFDLKPMKIGRRRVPSYELMHIYLKRMEEHRENFRKILQLRESEIPDVCDLYMWRDGRDQALAASKFTGMGSAGSGIKLMGAESVYTMHLQKRYISNDQSLWRHMIHNVTHLLASQMTPANWIGRLKAGWVDAGLAHYFEYLLDKKCTTYCFQEVATNPDFKGGKWRVPVRRMLATRAKIPSFAALAQRNTDQLKPKEHALCFSYVHFLIEGDYTSPVADKHGGKGRALVALIRALKAKKPVRAALKAGYGWNPLSFEEKWKEWVLRTYPTRETGN